MHVRIKYSDEPIGEPRIVRDFLPSPEELVFREADVRITITLSKKSVDFFKAEAARRDTQYQRMIRRLLDAQVEMMLADAPSRRPTRTRTKARAG